MTGRKIEFSNQEAESKMSLLFDEIGGRKSLDNIEMIAIAKKIDIMYYSDILRYLYRLGYMKKVSGNEYSIARFPLSGDMGKLYLDYLNYMRSYKNKSYHKCTKSKNDDNVVNGNLIRLSQTSEQENEVLNKYIRKIEK